MWNPSDGVGDRLDLRGREPPAVAREAARLQARVHRRAAELGDHDVRRLLDDQLGPALAEDRKRDLVRHRRGGQVDGLLVPQVGGRALLEREHGRILAALLVADLGGRHRRAHPGRRLRLGVRAEVDHAVQTNRGGTVER